jgi:hypothetical protein
MTSWLKSSITWRHWKVCHEWKSWMTENLHSMLYVKLSIYNTYTTIYNNYIFIYTQYKYTILYYNILTYINFCASIWKANQIIGSLEIAAQGTVFTWSGVPHTTNDRITCHSRAIGWPRWCLAPWLHTQCLALSWLQSRQSYGTFEQHLTRGFVSKKRLPLGPLSTGVSSQFPVKTQSGGMPQLKEA